MCIFTHFYTHIYMVTVIHIFNILLYFSLSLSLFFLTLHCRRSLFFFLSSRDLSDLSPWLTEWCCRSSIWYSGEPKWCHRSNILQSNLQSDHSKWCRRSSILSSIRSLKNSENRSPKLESHWGRRKVR